MRNVGEMSKVSMPKIRVLIADDQPVLGSGMRVLLEAQADLAVVGVASNASDANAHLAGDAADVVLFDLAIPGGGIQGLRTLLGAGRAKVIVLTFFANRTYIETALRLGAAGYLTKRATLEELIAAIRAVMSGKIYVERSLGYRASTRALPSPSSDRLGALSPRELQVLELIARGHTNREIAERLDVSVKTIEGYRARVLEKLGVRTRADLVAYAMLARLLPMGPASGLEDE